MRLKLFLSIFLLGMSGLIGCSSSQDKDADMNSTDVDNAVVSAYNNSPQVNIPGSIFPALGNPAAKIRIDVFFDPWCPPCRTFDTVIRKFMEAERYQKNAVVYFHLFPLIGHFPNDREASLLHLEMAKQGLFMRFREAVVEQNIGTYSAMFALAQKMSRSPFTEKDIERNAALLKAQQDVVASLNLSHTPTVFINKREIMTIPSAEELAAGVDEILGAMVS